MSEVEVLTGTTHDDLERLRATIEEALAHEDKLSLLRHIQDAYPADVAEALESFDIEKVVEVFKTLLLGDVQLCAEVLIEMDLGIISQLYPFLNPREWIWIFGKLSDDDVVEILELFPEEAQGWLVARLSEEDKEDVLQLMNYPEDSAGRIMTNEFVSMDVGETVAAATERIRNTRDLDPMNLFFVYVTQNEKLVGMVSMRQLLLNKRVARLGEIMRTDVIPIHVNTDQEEVAELVRKHDEVTVPVVDAESHILGIITVDDIIDVIDEESDEDIYKIIGTSDEELLVGDRTHKIVFLRLPWILASFLGSLMVTFILGITQADVFGSMAGRIFMFVPMICAMGGNVGVQSATIMARYLSGANLDWKEARRSTFKEAKVGLMLGGICGVLIGGIAYFWGGLPMLITVMMAMIAAMTTAATTGTIIPVVMKRLGFDPALATGPFVTSFNDLVATSVYLTIAFLFLDYLVV